MSGGEANVSPKSVRERQEGQVRTKRNGKCQHGNSPPRTARGTAVGGGGGVGSPGNQRKGNTATNVGRHVCSVPVVKNGRYTFCARRRGAQRARRQVRAICRLGSAGAVIHRPARPVHRYARRGGSGRACVRVEVSARA